MEKSVQDLIDDVKIRSYKDFDETSLDIEDKRLTSLKGIENYTNLKEFSCRDNQLESLNGIEDLTTIDKILAPANKLINLDAVKNLVNVKWIFVFNNKIKSLKPLENLINLESLDCSRNQLESLEGIENLPNLKIFLFKENPCAYKYEGLSVKQIQEKIKIELRLKPEDELRGAASIMDTGLFDFKMTK